MTSDDLFFQERNVISVLPATHVDKAYHYVLPQDCIPPSAGTLVGVTFNKKEIYGIVWPSDTAPPRDTPLKEISNILQLPPLPKNLLTFIERTADYTMSMRGAILKMVLSEPSAFKAGPMMRVYKTARYFEQTDTPLTPQNRILEQLSHTPGQTASQLAKTAGCTTSVVQTLRKKGLIISEQIPPRPPCVSPDPDCQNLALTSNQNKVATQLREALHKKCFSALLLDGVTGSGKTETYFEAIAEALRRHHQVLILLPEIALSNAFLDRFEQRFGCKPALWHSSLTRAQRRITWRGVAQGHSKVIVGARSALYMPFQNLGLIIVDEEHDPAFKQEDQVIYHARDMAVLRAHLGAFPIILVSATPSIETIHNSWTGRYQHLNLPGRYGGAWLPEIHVIDMRLHKPGDAAHFIAAPLQEKLRQAYEKNEQSLLFLNRRGYAPLTICRDCGHRMECPNCSAWLTEHRNGQVLLCHHCGYRCDYPEHCPACHASNSLAACGPGVERIAEEVQEYFPKARLEILTSDLMDTHAKLERSLERIKRGEIDIIIGTQIIAKGHHFPKLTCVGVIDADLGLAGGDLRATEKTYQLLHQVAGRAGRESKGEEQAGQVFIQTWMPDNLVIQALASGQRDLFFEHELTAREQAQMPPFTRLVALVITSANEDQALQTARLLAQTAPRGQGIQVLGPAPAPLYRLRNKYRQRLLVIAEKKLYIQKTLQHWLEQIKHPSSVRIYVDIDPQNFY